LRRSASALVAAVLLAPAAHAAGAGTASSYSFGRVGGNIQPFTVRVAADGTVTSTGPVEPTRTEVSAATRALIARVVTAQRFFALPARITCQDTLPDFAGNTVTVVAGGRKHTVVMRGACNTRFKRVYNALAAATGVDKL
jgi:hypothetical protein